MSATADGTGADGVLTPGPVLETARAALEAQRPIPIGDLFESVEAQIAAERGVAARLRAQPTPLRLVIACAGIGLLVAFGGVVGHGSRGPSSALGYLLLVGLPLALLVGAVTTALRPLHRPELPAWRRRLADLAPFAVMLVLCFVPDLLAQDGISTADALAGAVRALPCLSVGTIAAAAAFSMVRMLDRTTYGSALAAIGAAALASSITLQAFCPATSALHLCVGHFGAAIVFGAGALGLGAWARARRARRRLAS